MNEIWKKKNGKKLEIDVQIFLNDDLIKKPFAY